MIRLMSCVALAAIFMAGCASAPEQVADSRAAGTALPAAETQVAQPSAEAAPASSTTTTATGSTEAPASAAETATASATGTPVVVAADALTQPPGSVVICRDVLIQGSNVMTLRCMTRDDWKKFEYYQMIEAQETLRVLQNNGLR